MKISVHNSNKELAITPEYINALGMTSLRFTASDGGLLPYRQYISGDGAPGDFSLLFFLHGVGSVGDDNFLQTRIAAPPLIDYCQRHKRKMVIILPQCPSDSRWLDVEWSSLSHIAPEKPTAPLRRVIELLSVKRREFGVTQTGLFGGGISMGGYGIWDMQWRLPETFRSILSVCGGADTRKLAAYRGGAFLVHGSADATVPPERSRAISQTLLAQGNAGVYYRELPGVAHNAWDYAFEDEILDRVFAV